MELVNWRYQGAKCCNGLQWPQDATTLVEQGFNLHPGITTVMPALPESVDILRFQPFLYYRRWSVPRAGFAGIVPRLGGRALTGIGEYSVNCISKTSIFT